MEKDKILEILNDWNFWKREQVTGIERADYLLALSNIIKTTDSMLAVIGVRRAGKSFILRQLAKAMIEAGADSKDLLIVNFEDERFVKKDLELLREIYEVHREEMKPSPTKSVLFLDEIQAVNEWERFARGIHERKEAKIVVSGSSSKIMSDRLATLLSGRSVSFFIYPLSFREFMKFKNVVVGSRLDLVAKGATIRRLLKEYLEFGGFPEVVLSTDKLRILLSYFDTIVVKDVIDRFKIREREKARMLSKFYLTNVASPVTYRKTADFLGLSVKTTERFSNHLEIANLIFFVKRFSFSLKEQEKSPRKVYAVDIGLSNAVGFKFTENLGRSMENVVAVELKRRQSFDPSLESYYWKDRVGKEVDFVVKKGKRVVQLIQVCHEIRKPGVKEREIKSLIKASDELRCKDLVVVTWDYENEERLKKKTVRFIPLWKWLLV